MGPNVDKLFLEIAGKPVVVHTWQTFDAARCIDEIILVVRDGHVAVSFRAACDGCGLRAVTFGATVRPRLLRVPGVREVTCESVPLSPRRLDAIAAFAA